MVNFEKSHASLGQPLWKADKESTWEFKRRKVYGNRTKACLNPRAYEGVWNKAGWQVLNHLTAGKNALTISIMWRDLQGLRHRQEWEHTGSKREIKIKQLEVEMSTYERSREGKQATVAWLLQARWQGFLYNSEMTVTVVDYKQE